MYKTVLFCALAWASACRDLPSTGTAPDPSPAGVSDPNSTPSATNCTLDNAPVGTQVSLTKFQFSPACIKVAAGTAVTFTNADVGSQHTVTTEADQVETFDSGNFGNSATYPHTFSTPGSLKLFCKNHGNMHMTVVVF